MKFLMKSSNDTECDETLEGSEHGSVQAVKYTTAYLAERYIDPRTLENASAVTSHSVKHLIESGSSNNLWTLRAELARLSKEKEKLVHDNK